MLVGKGVGGYPEQPGGEWSAAPFVGWEVGEGSVKDLRGQIFRDRAVANGVGLSGSTGTDPPGLSRRPIDLRSR